MLDTFKSLPEDPDELRTISAQMAQHTLAQHTLAQHTLAQHTLA